MSRETVKENESLIKIWNTSRNDSIGLFPDAVTCGSKREAWWICQNGHEYQMPIVKKIRNPNSCPICSGHRTASGINDFATLYPEIASEWHPTKNRDLKPENFSKKNGTKVWWMCSFGHEWQATIHDRVGDRTGCPECNKRRVTSFPEQAILFYVKQLYPDAINKYKDIFDNSMELDIYIPSIKCGIEFDGAHWHKTENEHSREHKKYEICKKYGILLLRIKERTEEHWDDVADHIWYIDDRKHFRNQNLEQIISALLYSIDRNDNLWHRKNRNSYVNMISVNLDRDFARINSYLSEISNSLAAKRPDLVADWDYEANYPLTPEMFTTGSNDYANWKCSKCGHRWRTTINQRGRKQGSGCPVCSLEIRGKEFSKNYLAEHGSLADNYPTLAAEWHPTKNGEMTANDIPLNYNEKVWWLCKKCGYDWLASPNNRAKKVGCPACSGRFPRIGVNDLKTVNPELAFEWDYEKNDTLPEEYLPKSGKLAWWKCRHCGHSWEKEIRSRTNGSKCPNCKGKGIDKT